MANTYEFLKSIYNLFSKYKQEALDKVLEQDSSSDKKTLLGLSSNVQNPTTTMGYNEFLKNSYTDLSGLYGMADSVYTNINNLGVMLSLSQTQNNIILNDLGNSYIKSKDYSNNPVIPHTDKYVENFTASTTIEPNKSFYDNNRISKCFIDSVDSRLKLDIVGGFNHKATELNKTDVVMDRCLGIPVKNNTQVYNAFSNVEDPWVEELISDYPIYGNPRVYAWLPYTYAGGAACRIKFKLPNPITISEINFNPITDKPVHLIGIAYTDSSRNLIKDNQFATTITDSSNFWTINTSGLNNQITGYITQSGLVDNNNNTYVEIGTTVSSGTVYLETEAIELRGSSSLEVSMNLRTFQVSPISISCTYYSSALEALSDRTLSLDILKPGWSNINLTLDPAEAATYMKLRVIIPPFFQYKTKIQISNPSIEPLKIIETYEEIDVRKTHYLDYPISPKNLYLILSQENFNTETSIREIDFSRVSHTLDDSWNVKTNRNVSDKLNPFILNNPDPLFRELSSTALSSISNKEKKPLLKYQYKLGLLQVGFINNEYSKFSRFVSKPILPIGEIREIKLESEDSVSEGYSLGDIKYYINYSLDGITDNTIEITNLASSPLDTSSYTTTLSGLAYEGYTTWSSNTSQWYAVQYPAPPFVETPQTKEVLMTRVTNQAERNSYIVKKLPSAVDLRAYNRISFEFFTRVINLTRAGGGFKFAFGISNNGIDWIEKEFTSPLTDNWATDNTFNIVMNKGVISLSGYSPDRKNNVRYLRFRLLSETNYNEPIWFMFRKIKPEGKYSGAGAVRFFPADNLAPLGYDTLIDSDIVVPVKTYTEVFSGTDRFGRVRLDKYCYINRDRIMRLLQDRNNYNLSSNVNREVEYDPNSVYPKYLNNSSKIDILEGYRPIKVTVQTRDHTFTPDILGKPRKGDLQQVTREELSLATTSASSISILGTIVTNLDNVYQLKNKPISKGPISLKLEWETFDGNYHSLIDPLKYSINVDNKYLQLNTTAPSGSYTKVVASYWYILEEDSSRENFRFTDTATYTLASSSINNFLLTQKYPVTRNITDFVGGKKPQFKRMNLDILSPSYYPVLEYYITEDNQIVFSEEFLIYGDNPAEISVEYNSIEVNPRIIIDLERTDFTTVSPWVDKTILHLNVRRN